MSGLETAIRTALDRADRSNAEIRARIYQSARQALEAGLRKQNINDPEIIAEQRHRLEATIHGIEQEERAALRTAAAAAAQAVPSAPPGPPLSAGPAPGPAPSAGAPGPIASGETRGRDPDATLSFGAERDVPAAAPARGDGLADIRVTRDDRGSGEASPIDVAGDVPGGERRDPRLAVDGAALVAGAEPVAKPRRRRGALSRLFILVILLSAMGVAAWWIYSTGLLLTASERDTGLPPPTPSATAEDFGATQQPKTLDPRGGFSSDWVEVFTPASRPAMTLRPAATADVVGASDGQAVRITSRNADADGLVAIPVPQDLLQRMAGQTSTVAVTVQAVGEKTLQFSVACDFRGLGDCARHRFTATPEKADLLFQVDLGKGNAAGPGQVLINADVSGQGQGINLYAVRVLPGK